VVVVDDGSRSAAARAKLAELEARASRDARLRVVRKPNGGLGSARNAGIAQATGTYVLPLDSDDVIEPTYLELAVRALERCPELAAVSCYASWFEDGTAPEAICDWVIPYDLQEPLIYVENRAGVAASVFRREVFARYRYDEDLFAYEDWELWWQLALGGERVEVLPRVLFRYRRRAGSMVATVGYSRHAHLVAALLTRHGTALATRWPAVLRLYLEELVRTREDLAECRRDDDRRRAGTDGAGRVTGSVRKVLRGIGWRARALLRGGQ
jgi:glycosyltransferase involved in cell wall biosynthesis